jgi:hypothetical protein
MKDIMQRTNIACLIAELRAIELWDHIYALSDSPDAVDMTAWMGRRERQAEIYEELLAHRILESGQVSRA